MSEAYMNMAGGIPVSAYEGIDGPGRAIDYINRTYGPRKQVGGDHYAKHGRMQPFDIIDEYGLNFYEGSALKYLLRWRDKGGVLDLEKAKHYIEILIAKERGVGLDGNLPEAPTS